MKLYYVTKCIDYSPTDVDSIFTDLEKAKSRADEIKYYNEIIVRECILNEIISEDDNNIVYSTNKNRLG